MFNKYKQKIKDLEKELEITKEKARDNVSLFQSRDIANSREVDSLKKELKEKESTKDDQMAALMRESLGLQIDFSAANDKCLPVYYLEGMEENERKNFIIDMETIRNDEKFQKVVRYMINLFATNAIYKYEEEERKNGQVAVIAFRTLLKEFEKMHNEFLGYKVADEGFDPLATLPE